MMRRKSKFEKWILAGNAECCVCKKIHKIRYMVRNNLTFGKQKVACFVGYVCSETCFNEAEKIGLKEAK